MAFKYQLNLSELGCLVRMVSMDAGQEFRKEVLSILVQAVLQEVSYQICRRRH